MHSLIQFGSKILSSSKNAYLLLLLTFLFSCKKGDTIERQTLDKQFHGKYSIVSAVSNKEVDINLDGIKGTDALKEIPELKDSFLELIVRENTNSGVFAQSWQNQWFDGVEGKPVSYESAISVNFLNQPTVAGFKVDAQIFTPTGWTSVIFTVLYKRFSSDV